MSGRGSVGLLVALVACTPPSVVEPAVAPAPPSSSAAVAAPPTAPSAAPTLNVLPPLAVQRPGPIIDDVVEVAAGAQHTCVRRRGGGVACWGDNEHGEVGDGTTEGRFVATPVGVDDAASIDAGYGRTCVARRDGHVACWGGADGLVPRGIEGLDDVVEVAVARWTTCARRRGGRVSCWGKRKSVGGAGFVEYGLTEVPGLDDVVELSMGTRVACARDAAGGVWCWGDNLLGTLGVDEPHTFASTPIAVPGVKGATSIAVGEGLACAAAKGEVLCWGERIASRFRRWNPPDYIGPNQWRTLEARDRWAPFVVADLGPAEEVAAGASSACSRKGDTVRCLGLSGPRELDLTGASAIEVGDGHACALAAGTAACWGSNWAGQVGVGFDPRHAPAGLVLGIDDADDVAVGNDRACALRGDEVWCWGRRGGILDHDHRTRPTKFHRPARGVTIRGSTVCTLAAGGRLRCVVPPSIGRDRRPTIREYGPGVERLGPARHRSVGPPVDIAAVAGRGEYGLTESGAWTRRRRDEWSPLSRGPFVEVGAGVRYACARLQDGGVMCTGENTFGQLGVGSHEELGGPRRVRGIADAVSLGVGLRRACVVSARGTLHCWGEGVGLDGSDQHAPMTMPGFSQARAVGVGHDICVAERGGRIACLRKVQDEWRLQEIGSHPPVRQLAVGPVSCALHDDGRLTCWGHSRHGETGRGLDDRVRRPVVPRGLAPLPSPP